MPDFNDVENDYLNLPDDPEHGFAILQQRQYEKLADAWEMGGEGWNPERNYAETLVIYDKVYNLGLLDGFHEIPYADGDFADFFSKFRLHASFTSKRLLAEYARRTKLTEISVLELDQTAKEAIRNFITAIKAKLSDLDLNENKRTALLKKLSAFELELDLPRTRTEAFYQFVIETSRAAKEANEQIKPILNTSERIFKLFDKAKKAFDSLPPWQERKKIAGPVEQTESTDTDDEIPF